MHSLTLIGCSRWAQFLYLELAYQYARGTDNTASFRGGALDPSGRVRRVSWAQAPANPRSEHS